jgi:hypothetical protein
MLGELAVLSFKTTNADEVRTCRRAQCFGQPKQLTIAGEVITGVVYSVLEDAPMHWTVSVIPKTLPNYVRRGKIFALA